MKRLFLLPALLALTLPLRPQTNSPARPAVISATPDTGAAADVLTAHLSANPEVALPERDQIDNVYQEQGRSAENADCVKPGRLPGADGGLWLETTKEGTNQFLNARLIAVNPGVVPAAKKFPGPAGDPTEWATAFSAHLGILLPKLSVRITDAIPIAVVNLRPAVSSAEALETERELKLLTIRRLSGEPQLFVLERQRMELRTGEKELQKDDSPFGNGSYLLEGAVLLAARGSRTNLAEVINQLAVQVEAVLKVRPTVPAWNSADGAAQSFAETKWALRRGLPAEARAAADSAWASGKQDLGGATVRVRAWPGGLQTVRSKEQGTIDARVMASEPGTAEGYAAIEMQKAARMRAVVIRGRNESGLDYTVFSGCSGPDEKGGRPPYQPTPWRFNI